MAGRGVHGLSREPAGVALDLVPIRTKAETALAAQLIRAQTGEVQAALQA